MASSTNNPGASAADQVAEGGSDQQSLRVSNNARNNYASDDDDMEAAKREEILLNLSQNLISREAAATAWNESFERDLNKMKKKLLFLRKALRGKRGNRKRAGVSL